MEVNYFDIGETIILFRYCSGKGAVPPAHFKLETHTVSEAKMALCSMKRSAPAIDSPNPDKLTPLLGTTKALRCALGEKHPQSSRVISFILN